MKDFLKDYYEINIDMPKADGTKQRVELATYRGSRGIILDIILPLHTIRGTVKRSDAIKLQKALTKMIRHSREEPTK